MFRLHDFRRTITTYGQTYGVMILPVFSLSNPNQDGESRVVFDWGKGLSHPRADIAFAILSSPTSQYITKLIYRDIEYQVTGLRKCRSGRLAATVTKGGSVNSMDKLIIRSAIAQEFPEHRPQTK